MARLGQVAGGNLHYVPSTLPRQVYRACMYFTPRRLVIQSIFFSFKSLLNLGSSAVVRNQVAQVLKFQGFHMSSQPKPVH